MNTTACNLTAANEHNGSIVRVLRPGTKVLHFLDQAFYARVGLQEVLNQAGGPVFFVLLVHRFRDAVCIKQQLGAGLKLDAVLRVRRRTQTQRQTGIDIQERAVAINEQRAQVAGAGKRHLTRAGLQYAVDHRDKFAFREVL